MARSLLAEAAGVDGAGGSFYSGGLMQSATELNGQLAGPTHRPRVQGLPPVPAEAPAEPWQLAGVAPQGAEGGKLLIGLTLLASAADHRAYRLAADEHASDYQQALQQVASSFLSDTPEGRRLVAVRKAEGEALRLLAEAEEEVARAEAGIRTALVRGGNPEPSELLLRKSREDVAVFRHRVEACKEPLYLAEMDARRALAERLEGVRKRFASEAQKRFEQASNTLCEAMRQPALDLITSIAAGHTAAGPVPAELLKLPG